MDMKRKILDAAEQSLRASGYSEMSYRDIAASVGVKSSSVHYHFPGKELLAAATMDRYSKCFFETLEEAGPKTASPEIRLSAFVELHAAAFRAGEQTCLCAILSSESVGLPEAVTRSVRAHVRLCLDWLEAIAPADEDNAAFAAGVFATIQGALVVANVMQSPELLETALGRASRSLSSN